MEPIVTIDQNGEIFIAGFEGTKYVAYQDDDNIWTIGKGHKILLPQEKYLLTAKLGDPEVMQLFNQDLRVVEQYVVHLSETWPIPINQVQFNALGDFVYQYGTNLKNRFPNTYHILVSGDINNICIHLLDFTNEKVTRGDGKLLTRRHKEIALLKL